MHESADVVTMRGKQRPNSLGLIGHGSRGVAAKNTTAELRDVDVLGGQSVCY